MIVKDVMALLFGQDFNIVFCIVEYFKTLLFSVYINNDSANTLMVIIMIIMYWYFYRHASCSHSPPFVVPDSPHTLMHIPPPSWQCMTSPRFSYPGLVNSPACIVCMIHVIHPCSLPRYGRRLTSPAIRT